jgi:hypothetical protein
MARQGFRLFVATAAGLAACGCDAQPRAGTPDSRTASTETSTVRPGSEFALAPALQPQKPDLSRLEFELSTRKLTLYDLPDRASRWMLASPDAPGGVPVDREFQFPPEVDLDLDQIAVYYTVPNRRPSPSVSLREILDAHASRLLR